MPAKYLEGRTRRPVASFLAALAVAFLGCSGGTTEPTPEPPVITVEGVAEGQVYTSPVRIDIEVDRGTYSATLDGVSYLPGTEVSDFGDHRLEVVARNGTATSTRSIGFRIEAPEGRVLIVRMFDLGDNEAGGGGDAILLTDSAQGLQVHALVDAGPAGENASDPDLVAGRLRALGVTRLEALILTHAHTDHFAGMPAVFGEVEVERFIYNGQVRNLGMYTQLIQEARARADTVIVPDTLLTLSLSGPGGTEIGVIPPLESYLDDGDAGSSELNDGSLGALVRRGTFELFLTGDGEVEANTRWRTEFAGLSEAVDALKVGHHGANDAIFDAGASGSSAWLAHTDPEILLISANGRSHPRQNALAAILGRTGTRTYCTNVHGDVELRVYPGGTTVVTVQANADEACEAGSEASS